MGEWRRWRLLCRLSRGRATDRFTMASSSSSSASHLTVCLSLAHRVPLGVRRWCWPAEVAGVAHAEDALVACSGQLPPTRPS